MSGRPCAFMPVALALSLSLWLAACSAPSTRVVLLPQEGDAPSAVVVRAKAGPGAETVVSQPYQRATVASGASRAPRVDQADPAKVQAEHRSLFDMRPPVPQRYTLYFDAGGTVLTAESQLVLEQVLAAALARSGGDVVITGHTDTVGSGASNDALSAQRAQQVRQMLGERQFPIARIEAAGRGERELAVPTADEVDEPRNRRVIVEVR